MPDIIVEPRNEGVSTVNVVIPAVQKIIDMGIVDPEHIGFAGHSHGGYESAFLSTQTDLFAAFVEGSGITNWLSFPGQVHFNGGEAEFSHDETGQGRFQVPPWEDLKTYLRNSPINYVTHLHTPMLMFAGSADGTVDWHQAIQFYNFARRAGSKNLVLLVYPGANHHPVTKSDKIDYHIRILQWFGHWLKGEPAKPWMKRGATYLERFRRLNAAGVKLKNAGNQKQPEIRKAMEKLKG